MWRGNLCHHLRTLVYPIENLSFYRFLCREIKITESRLELYNYIVPLWDSSRRLVLQKHLKFPCSCTLFRHTWSLPKQLSLQYPSILLMYITSGLSWSPSLIPVLTNSFSPSFILITCLNHLSVQCFTQSSTHFTFLYSY